MRAKIPPDIVLIGCGVLMWLSARCLPRSGLDIPYHTVLSGLIALFGLVIIVSAKAALRKHRTTAQPGWRSLPTASVLVTTGVYNLSRNPIYLGMALLLVGWGGARKLGQCDRRAYFRRVYDQVPDHARRKGAGAALR
ncbi:hypothetical protein JHJ32_21065 [Parapedobacter sp. ISTM3]|uniref:methyltransferase family protein n=1 Tax=Parapedobacter sp. ISTM3 TaxID=2800130 RepID=UPI001907BD31|nr:methyltransferase [Parapedobacter sp. ISTM3]MBK1442503.1 hypothetical protein [Parapedobacter sp. ISTM3]